MNKGNAGYVGTWALAVFLFLQFATTMPPRVCMYVGMILFVGIPFFAFMWWLGGDVLKQEMETRRWLRNKRAQEGAQARSDAQPIQGKPRMFDWNKRTVVELPEKDQNHANN